MTTGFYYSLIFLGINVGVLLLILFANQPRGRGPGGRKPGPAGEGGQRQEPLDPSNILEWEFEYARITASEAMQDRHTMVNYYLLIVGVLVSGLVAALGQHEIEIPVIVGTVLLWLLCGIGWLLFLMLIRLRQAWHDSAKAMNQIKTFYVQHADKFAPGVLWDAFRWQPHTLPPPDKRWTVFHYSAMLIGFLDSAAYVAGGVLLHLHLEDGQPLLPLGWGLMAACGLVFFAFHAWLYRAFLRPPVARAQGGNETEVE